MGRGRLVGERGAMTDHVYVYDHAYDCDNVNAYDQVYG